MAETTNRLSAENAISPEALGRGFADPVHEAQRTFRAVLSAMSEPGRLHTLAATADAPTGLAPATALVLLTLADLETPVWLAPSLTSGGAAWLRFHCGAPIVADPSKARFAVLDGGIMDVPLHAFDPGDDRYPDKSATVIVQASALEGGAPVTLSGPGIQNTRRIAPLGLHAGFWDEVAANHASYPLGIDIILAAGSAIIALPRSTHVTPGEAR